MTFFDKFFTIRNRTNKADNNGFKLAIEPLRSSVFEITKSQIRVVLFRECDRWGRKLLFDSNAVEKLPLTPHIKAKEILSKSEHDQLPGSKLLDFDEVTNSHGYRCKKPSSDVTLLGEMIFGSVAMVLKGGTMCKIHSLASSKCIMFTNIIHAPTPCHYLCSSAHYVETNGSKSGSSLLEYSSDERASSSDSKLYRHKESSKTSPSTYPCIKHKSTGKKLYSCECCNSALKSSNKIIECGKTNEGSLGKLGFNAKDKCERFLCLRSNNYCEKVNEVNRDTDYKHSELSLNISEKDNTECKCEFGDNFGSFSDFYECNKDTFSGQNGLNSSLSSLRRRWMQSCSSSVDEACYEEVDNSKIKTRTKLGLGVVVDLSNNLENELEKFLFNHTIVIESILKKLESSIEAAYMKKENFVDLTYTAFINCQQSIYELITGGKYAKPMWLTLSGAVPEEYELGRLRAQDKVFSQFHENIKDCKSQDTLYNVKLKFLNDFCDVIMKFDTKDTNFFISTLLTAVLTHHLSWVTGIAESDISLPQHKLQYVIKGLRPYNPIWAQLNDLNGILGSPLKSARTVIAGCETGKNNIASIIKVLTYFIRCYNVIENVYNFDFEEVTRTDEENPVTKSEDLDIQYITKMENDAGASQSKNYFSVVDLNVERGRLCAKDALQTSTAGISMKKSNSCIFRSDGDLTSNEHNISRKDLKVLENLQTSNKDEYMEASYFFGENKNEKVKKLIRVPSRTVISHIEQSFSPDEGYDTVDSSEVYAKKDGNEYEEPRDNVLFVLGENDELVNLKRAATNKLQTVNQEKEGDRKQVSVERKNLCGVKPVVFPVLASDIVAENFRTFDICDSKRVSSGSKQGDKVVEHSWDSTAIGIGGKLISSLRKLPMPELCEKSCTKTRLDVSSVLGSVNDHYNSEQIIQGVLEDKSHWEKVLRRDLALRAHNPVVDRNVTEAVCIIGDMNSWEVSLHSSRNFTIDRNNFSGIRIGMSQLVADMLESLLHICRIKLPPDFCLGYIERKLHEIYTKSKSVAELLNSTEMCSLDYLTSRLDVTVNDVPLLLSVATTHSPKISSKYGLTFT